jgi:SAM-dependent methyltransferase
MDGYGVKVRFDYGHYLDSVQDGEQVKQSLKAFVPFFRDCEQVLDLGCGTGPFLEHLRNAGINAVGVDADSLAAEQATASGLHVIRADVLEFVRDSKEVFDGVFCSHLVEHLPLEALVDLVEGIARRLTPRGILVMAFPNPESLDMQLFHFWVDPQHVRFYHPTLIQAMLRHYGLEVEQCTFRNWRTGEFSRQSNGSPNGGLVLDGQNNSRGIVSRMGHRLKEILGITRLENEVDYVTRLKSIGEEAVIVARRGASDWDADSSPKRALQQLTLIFETTRIRVAACNVWQNGQTFPYCWLITAEVRRSSRSSGWKRLRARTEALPRRAIWPSSGH